MPNCLALLNEKNKNKKCAQGESNTRNKNMLILHDPYVNSYLPSSSTMVLKVCQGYFIPHLFDVLPRILHPTLI
jgi:hypothetical protein